MENLSQLETGIATMDAEYVSGQGQGADQSINDPNRCPFEDGQLLKIVMGDHRGMIVRVDEQSSFPNPTDVYYSGNPANGIVSKAGWQIVLDVERDGKWLYIFREHEDDVRRLTTPVDAS